MATQGVSRKDMLLAGGLLHRVAVETLALLSVSSQETAPDPDDGRELPRQEAIARWVKFEERMLRHSAKIRSEMTVVELAEYEVEKRRLQSVGATIAPLA